MDPRDWLCTLLAPSYCMFCDRPVPEFRNGTVCHDCWDSLEPMKPACSRCGQHYASGPCSECAQCLPLVYLDFARSFGLYRNELGRILRQYKYRADQSLAPGLVRLLELAFRQNFSSLDWDVLAIVPTHAARVRDRGFDHLRLLSRLLSGRIAVPARRILSKRLASRPQAGLTEKQRRRNVRRSFALRGSVEGGRILLLDDILTTGATANECARVLKRGGASRVGVLTVARAP
ncbi:MAG TPA: ComF family protein [Acidobacteriota bacterium]